MKRRDVLLCAAFALPAALGLDTKAHAQLEGGIDELTREMGFALELPLRQAVAVTGALLHIAREKLPTVEFSEVTRFLPGVERLMLQAVNEASSALPKTMDGLAPFLEKLALPRKLELTAKRSSSAICAKEEVGKSSRRCKKPGGSEQSLA